jgi:hypothetical protein
MLDRTGTVIAHSAHTPDLKSAVKPTLFNIALILPKKVWNFLSTFPFCWGVPIQTFDDPIKSDARRSLYKGDTLTFITEVKIHF